MKHLYFRLIHFYRKRIFCQYLPKLNPECTNCKIYFLLKLKYRTFPTVFYFHSPHEQPMWNIKILARILMFTNMFKCSIRSACCPNPRILRLRMGLCAASVAGELEACRRMYWHRMENLKSAKRILSSPVSCTFGE